MMQRLLDVHEEDIWYCLEGFLKRETWTKLVKVRCGQMHSNKDYDWKSRRSHWMVRCQLDNEDAIL